MNYKRLKFPILLLVISVLSFFAIRLVVATVQASHDMRQVQVFQLSHVSVVSDSETGNSLVQGVDTSTAGRIIEISVRKPTISPKSIKSAYLYKNEMATVDKSQMQSLLFKKHYAAVNVIPFLAKLIIAIILTDTIVIIVWAGAIIHRLNMRHKRAMHSK